MADLDAIRERHQPIPGRMTDNVYCAVDGQPWGNTGCDTVQAFARVAELEAALDRAARLVHVANINNPRHVFGGWEKCPAPICRSLDAALARPESAEAEFLKPIVQGEL